MNCSSRTVLLAAILWPLTWVVPAGAQVKCPEGRTLNGDCVNAGLAASMRQTSIIFSQPKISQTAFPILPSVDRLFRYPNQLIPDPLKPAPVILIPQ
jgi:hypothetical protein